MILTELIKEQIFEAFVMLAGGAGLGAMYSLFICFKNLFLRFDRGAGALAEAAEVLFFIFAALYIVAFLKYASEGEISFHNFLAMTIGVLLWQRLFYGKIKC